MCFEIHKDFDKQLIASKDLTVWKRLVVSQAEDLTLIHSPYRQYEYKIGEHNTLDRAFDCSLFQIAEGFHAYSNARRAVNSAHSDESIFRCTVPKGSIYYWNPDHYEIVSDELIINELILPSRYDLGTQHYRDAARKLVNLSTFKWFNFFQWRIKRLNFK